MRGMIFVNHSSFGCTPIKKSACREFAEMQSQIHGLSSASDVGLLNAIPGSLINVWGVSLWEYRPLELCSEPISPSLLIIGFFPWETTPSSFSTPRLIWMPEHHRTRCTEWVLLKTCAYSYTLGTATIFLLGDDNSWAMHHRNFCCNNSTRLPSNTFSASCSYWVCSVGHRTSAITTTISRESNSSIVHLSLFSFLPLMSCDQSYLRRAARLRSDWAAWSASTSCRSCRSPPHLQAAVPQRMHALPSCLYFFQLLQINENTSN